MAEKSKRQSNSISNRQKKDKPLSALSAHNGKPQSASKSKQSGQSASSGQNNLKKFHMTDPANRNDKIMTVLDKLGQKFIESEADRISLKRHVDDQFNGQKEIDRKLKRQMAMAEKLESQLNETILENERLRETMNRSEKQRVRLIRRMERVETIATDAQSALEAKAIVLLTDKALVDHGQYPQISATGSDQVDYGVLNHNAGMLGYDAAQGQAQGQTQGVNGFAQANHPAGGQGQLFGMTMAPEQAPLPWWKRGIRTNVTTVMAFLLLAVVSGWAFSELRDDSAANNSAFAIMQDGKLARVDFSTGEITPVLLAAQKKLVRAEMSKDLDVNLEKQASELNAESGEGEVIAEDGTTIEQLSEIQTVLNAVNIATSVEQKPLTERIKADAALKGELKDLEQRAFDGHSESQHDLAALYTAGQGVKQSYSRAAAWFEEAANAGISNASYNLGVLYHQGMGVKRDMPMALDWYRRAALQGHAEAQYNLGIAYIEGLGAKYNPNLASSYFQQSALNGIVEGAYNLGLILENGLLEQGQTEQAMIWYRAAADKGSEDAQQALAKLADRLGVDIEKAGLIDGQTALSGAMKDLEKVQPANGFAAAATLPESKTVDLDLKEFIPTWDNVLIAEIQGQLTNAGLYSGAQDGVVNAATTEAVKTYQTIHGMDITGAPAQDLLLYMLAMTTGENKS